MQPISNENSNNTKSNPNVMNCPFFIALHGCLTCNNSQFSLCPISVFILTLFDAICWKPIVLHSTILGIAAPSDRCTCVLGSPLNANVLFHMLSTSGWKTFLRLQCTKKMEDLKTTSNELKVRLLQFNNILI